MSFLSSCSSQLDVMESEGRYMEMSKFILNMMIKNMDLSPLAGKVIKFLAIPHPPCKKVMYSFLTKYSSNIADLSILATNSLLKDFQDPNPFIRRLVIRTIGRISCLSELALQLLPQALKDNSSYVRVTAASSCSLIINEINIKDNQDIVNNLYELIRDPDPSVICSSLAALEEILHADGGVAMNSKIALYLLNRMPEFQEWNVSVIYSVMKKYIPRNLEELLKFLNALDEKLQNSHPAVFIIMADLSLNYIYKMNKEFSADIIHQILPQLKLMLNHSSTEVQSSTLETIETFISEHKPSFVPLFKLFFCRFCDTTLIKVKKLSLLPILVNLQNIAEINDHLLLHCCDTVKEVSSQAVSSFANVIKEYGDACNNISTFVDLMDISFNDLSVEVLNSLSTLNLSKNSHIKECIITGLSKHVHTMYDNKSNLSILKLLSRYGTDIDDAPYIIEKIINDENNIENGKLMCILLTTAVKLFFSRPSEMQLLLGCILEMTKKSSSFLLRQQSAIYYHLLKNCAGGRMFLQEEETFISN